MKGKMSMMDMCFNCVGFDRFMTARGDDYIQLLPADLQDRILAAFGPKGLTPPKVISRPIFIISEE